MTSRTPEEVLFPQRLERKDSTPVLFAALLLMAAAVAAYWNSIDGVFLFDDKHFWEFEDHLAHPSRIVELQRPVAMFTFAANYHLNRWQSDSDVGLKAANFHVTNILIHLLAALALLGIVRRTLLNPRVSFRYQHAALPLATAISLLWLVHPLQTGSVTYIVQRFESLAGMFYLLTLYCYIRGAEAPAGVTGFAQRSWWWSCSVVACCLGMGCKEWMVTAPLVVLWYDRAFTANSWKELLTKRWVYHGALALTTAALMLPLAVDVLSRLVPQIVPTDKAAAPAQTSSAVVVEGLTPLSYLRSQPGVILHYLRLSFWPDELCLDYGWPVATTPREIYLPLAIVGGLILLTVVAIWLWPMWSFVGAWFFLILAPTSSIVPIKDLAFEHRMYLPLASVITLAVVGFFELSRFVLKKTSNLALAEQRSHHLLFTGSFLVALVLTLLTVQRNFDYHSEVGMWADVAAKRPYHRRAQFNYAESLVAAADRLKRPSKEAGDMYELATEAYRRSLAVDPKHVASYNNLGETYVKLGHPELAEPQFQRALQIDPANAEARRNLQLLHARRPYAR